MRWNRVFVTDERLRPRKLREKIHGTRSGMAGLNFRFQWHNSTGSSDISLRKTRNHMFSEVFCAFECYIVNTIELEIQRIRTAGSVPALVRGHFHEFYLYISICDRPTMKV